MRDEEFRVRMLNLLHESNAERRMMLSLLREVSQALRYRAEWEWWQQATIAERLGEKKSSLKPPWPPVMACLRDGEEV